MFQRLNFNYSSTFSNSLITFEVNWSLTANKINSNVGLDTFEGTSFFIFFKEKYSLFTMKLRLDTNIHDFVSHKN